MQYNSTVPIDLYQRVADIVTTASGEMICYTRFLKKSRMNPPSFIALSEIEHIKLKHNSICLIIPKQGKKRGKPNSLSNNLPDYYIDLEKNPAIEASLKTSRLILLNGKLVWYGEIPQNAIPANISNYVRGAYYAVETEQWYWRTREDKHQYELKQILTQLTEQFEYPYPNLNVICANIGNKAIQWLLTQTGYTYLYWNTKKSSQPGIKLPIKNCLLHKSSLFHVNFDPQDLLHCPHNSKQYNLLVIPDHTTCSYGLTKNILQETPKIEGVLIVYTLSVLYKIRHQFETESIYVFASFLFDYLPWERFSPIERQEYESIFEEFWFDTIPQNYQKYNAIEPGHTFSQKLGIYLADFTTPEWLNKDEELPSLVNEIHALLENIPTAFPNNLFDALNVLWLYYHNSHSQMRGFCRSLAHFLIQQIEVKLSDFLDIFFQYFEEHPPFVGQSYSFPDLILWDEPLPPDYEDEDDYSFQLYEEFMYDEVI